MDVERVIPVLLHQLDNLTCSRSTRQGFREKSGIFSVTISTDKARNYFQFMDHPLRWALNFSQHCQIFRVFGFS